MRNLFKSRPHPYYIYAHDYRRTSAGVRVLHMLCDALRQSGQEAYVYADIVNPDLMTPQLTNEVIQLHRARGLEPIMVYPEVIDHNPFQGNVIVRYLLNVPGLLAGSGKYGDNDILFAYSKGLLQEGMPADQILFLPALDTNIFKPPASEKNRIPGKACYYLGRNRHIEIPPALLGDDPIEITQTFPSSWEELVSLFHQCEYFYTADSSGLVAEAALCGCIGVVLPSQWTGSAIGIDELGSPGVAQGIAPAEIERARRSLGELKINIQKQAVHFWTALDHFIDVTQQRARDYGKKTALAAPAAPPVASKKRLVVLSAEPASGPCPYIRFTKPFALLKDEWELGWGIKDNNVDLNLLRDADLIVMQRYAPGLFSLDTLKQLFALGKPVIYETDDLLNDIPDYHPQAASGRQWKEGIEYAASHAQAIVASTTYLADKLQHLNPAVYVLPNYLDFDMFYRPVPPIHDGQINIGLLGTSLQGPNFALVDVALHEICRRYPGKIRLFFVGWAPPAGWENHPDASFVPVIDSYENYATKLKQMNWDISLIPLADDQFNYSKTAIKWLEYSAAGIASVFSDVTIYRNAVTHDHTGMLAPDSPQAWIDAIALLIDNPQKRHDIAQTAQDEVRRYHSINDNAVHYGELYGRLLQDSVAQPATITAATPTAAAPVAIQPHVTAAAKKRLLVFSVESTWSPCPQIRFILPFSFLTAEWELIWGIKDGKVDSSELPRADLILLHRSAPGLFPQADLDTIFSLGKPIIYETDDLLNDIPDYHPQAADSKKWKPGIEYAVQKAHAVVVSTPFLADKYRAMNPNVHVLQNYLDFDRFYRPVPVRNDGSVTIGLLGTSIQGPNFALVDQALRSICDRFPGRIKLYFVGWNMPSGWEGHPAVEFLPFIHEYQSYAARLLEMQWDIALVPLVNDDFNHSKSAIKWLEYAAAGIAPVFSDVSVYRNVVEDGRTGLLVQESPAAWLEALSLLLENPQRRHDIAVAAQEEVRQHYALKEKSALYAQRYGAFAAGEFAAENPPGTTPGVLLLDPKGNATAVAASLQSLADSRFSDVVTIVLTTRDEVPAWTEEIRFVQIGADEYAAAVGQLSVHPDFVWVATLEAGNTISS